MKKSFSSGPIFFFFFFGGAFVRYTIYESMHAYVNKLQRAEMLHYFIGLSLLYQITIYLNLYYT